MRSRTRIFIAGAVVALFAALSAVALGTSVHFKKGSPVFTDQGLSLSASGALAGLGHGDVGITVTATGQPVAVPGGGDCDGRAGAAGVCDQERQSQVQRQ